MSKINITTQLPKDLLECENSISKSIINCLSSGKYNRIGVSLNFEGLQLAPLIIRLSSTLSENKIKNKIAFSDFGSSALAKRDYSDFANVIFTFKELLNNDQLESQDLIIAVSPQPYDYDEYEKLCLLSTSNILMINGRLEETTIGVGFVGRERRSSFIKSWKSAYYLEPFIKGALLYEYPNQWLLYRYTPDGYIYHSSFQNKPTTDDIELSLI